MYWRFGITSRPNAVNLQFRLLVAFALGWGLAPACAFVVVSSGARPDDNGTNMTRMWHFDHAASTFGLQPPYNVSAAPALLDPEDRACEPLVRERVQGRVLLALRGKCKFHVKASMAQEAGAVGLVVGDDNADSTTLWRMTADAMRARDIRIPVVFLRGVDFGRVSELLRSESGARVVLGGPADVIGWDPLQPMVVNPLFEILWWMLGFSLMAKYVRRRRAGRVGRIPVVDWEPDLENPPRRPPGEEIDVDKYTSMQPKKRVINATCTVCFEDFAAGEKVKALPCSHGFHAACIDPWLIKHSDRCPICNHSILKPGPQRKPAAEAKSGATEMLPLTRRHVSSAAASSSPP